MIRVSRLFVTPRTASSPRKLEIVAVLMFFASCVLERHSRTLFFTVAASKVALCGTHHHLDQARNCFGTTTEQKVGPTATSTWHFIQTFGRQLWHKKFCAVSRVRPWCAGRTRRSSVRQPLTSTIEVRLTQQIRELKRSLPVKMRKLQFPSGECAMCCACHRGGDRSAHSPEDSEDTSRFIVKKNRKQDGEVLLCATPCVQFYSTVISHLDIGDVTAKLYKDRVSKQCFLEHLNTISKLVGERGFLPESVAASNGVRVFVEKRITVVSVGEFHQEFGQNALQRIERNHPQMKVMAMNWNRNILGHVLLLPFRTSQSVALRGDPSIQGRRLEYAVHVRC